MRPRRYRTGRNRLGAVTDVAIPVTGDPDADRLLVDDPLALLIGMLLDQQVPMEWAFRGPFTLRERLGVTGHLDAQAIAAMAPDELEALFLTKPALHRYPASMAKRTHDLCRHLVDEYGGDAAAVWRDASSGEELYQRLRALPGYGDEKAKIFLAILGKRLSVAPPGWEQAAAPFSDTTPRSVADIDSPESLLRVREWKTAQKAMKKAKTD
ncbi:MAG: Fe-S cluster assembly protein HesB [Actinobacteria bacterium]|nr:Fe-S cluster assembly protein HesB [Actinomycetota bacterium]